MASEKDADTLPYERFFQTTGDLLCVLDPAGRFARTNAAFRDVLGYTEQALIGEAFVRIVHPDDAGDVRRFIEGGAEGGEALRVLARFLHRDLSYRRLLFSLRRVIEGDAAAIYGAGRDALERETDDMSRRREAVLQKMQETARIGGWELVCATGELYWTDETYRLHEVPPGFTPVVEKGLAFYAPESVPIITAAVEACMKEGKAYNLELEIITAKGRRLWVRATGEPVLQEGKVIRLIGAFQDIHEFKQREIELKEKLAIIEEQRSAINAMSAPIIQVWDGVLALPVVGALDKARAAEITGRILEAVVAQRAKYAILDLTGVAAVDEETADHMVRIIRAITLLGAQSIVTGIRPAVAQTLTALDAGFAGAMTVSNLREAIKICMRWRQE